MDKIRSQKPHTRRAARLLAAATLTSALALGGCASTSGTSAGAKPATPSSTAAADARQDEALKDAAVSATKTQDHVAAAAYWGGLYDRNPDNVEAAIAYSKSLRQIGSVAQAVSVMQRVQLAHGEDAGVLAEYGKALAASGRPDQAVAYLSRAATQNPGDWTVLSAQGVALDQMSRYGEAQEKYDAALKIEPGNPFVLTNLGLSYALRGDLDRAEETLRKAAADPRANASVRQNLVIVLGLKGNFEEASRLARADLPVTVADNNIAYLKDMVNQPALWKQMEKLDGAQTSTEAPSSLR